MRPGQHNKRSRGRGSRRHGGGGGGGGNPLNRVYESNGPDVKVRGTAQTVADKYLQLGRDAQSSGDAVMAESYYQHAEHYLRLLAAAQAYNQQMQPQFRQSGQEDFDEAEGEDVADEAGEGQPQMGERPPMPQDQQEPPMGFEGERPPQSQYPPREFRPRHEGRDRFRPRWQDRQGQGSYREGGEPQSRHTQPRASEEGVSEERAARQDETNQREGASWGEGEQPSFLRRPLNNGQQRQRFERRPRREAAASGEGESTETPPPAAEVPTVD
jgi:hypothetical protein